MLKIKPCPTYYTYADPTRRRMQMQRSRHSVKNEQVKKVFWTLFVSMDGQVLARMVDPVIA
jgi:hypothetical protein